MSGSVVALVGFVSTHFHFCWLPARIYEPPYRRPCSSLMVEPCPHLQILRANGLILTRIQHNCQEVGLLGCKDVLIYNHGFPDSSVIPTALKDYTALSESQSCASVPLDGYFSSRLPRKWCEYVMKHLRDAAFVAFNTRGVPGSSSMEPEKVETAPAEFEKKTLTGDLEDISAISSLMRQKCPNARITVCGMSTGAFLALAFAARQDLHPLGGIAGCITLACVEDIPSSAPLDFSEEQRASFESQGFCLKEFFPHGADNNPQMWKLSRDYYDSYAQFPTGPALAASLSVHTLLLHGADDRHVPSSHGEALLKTLQQHSKAPVELVRLSKGNHFLSSTPALNQALAAVKAFLISRGCTPK